jgi:nicotinamidase-related amidase
MQDIKKLPLPSHYDAEIVGEVWRVNYHDRAADARDWSKQQAIPPASSDELKIALLLIDLQNTFCIPGFELFVAGRSGVAAVEDNRRLCEFIYRNLGSITSIQVTLDTHRAMQIFHPVYLINAEGEHPAALTMVSYDDVRKGRWRFNPLVAESLGVTAEQGQEQLLHYARKLEEQGKYELTIWPYHAMLGGIGHALVAAVEEALFFHTIARSTQPSITIKGEYPNTESYSAIGPEVLLGMDGQPIASKDRSFLQAVIEHDMLVVAGQAKSHCVASTVSDLLEGILEYDPQLVQKIYLLEDCTSPVVVPGLVDFSDQADQAYREFAAAGMHLVRSADPLEEWPGVEGLITPA